MQLALTDSIPQVCLSARPVRALSAGDAEIQSEVISLFDSLRDPVLRYILSFGISVPDGEEITQEVFLALFRHLQLGKTRRNLRSWIFRVAHNLALKQRHSNHRSRESTNFDWTTVEARCDLSLNPEEQTATAERRRRLLAILHALPSTDRCCLRLRIEGMRYREIARILDISLGAVSISLARSLAKLIHADGI